MKQSAQLGRLLLTSLIASFLFTPALRGDEKKGVGKPPAAHSHKKLLVISSEQFHKTLQDFVEHKRRLIPTDLVSLESVLRDSAGHDDPERIKRFLYVQWKEHNAGYALLVGDVDVFPVRYMVLDRVTPAAFDYAFYPCDLYYSDLAKADRSFDDWNAQKEGYHAGYFGEVHGEKNKSGAINFDHVDYRPEIGVGRWPVSTPEEVQIVAGKTIAYETKLSDKQRPGLKAAALFSVGGWVDSRSALDRIATRLPSNWKKEKRYYADQQRNDKTPPPTEPELVGLLDAGQRLVFHAGHGQDDAWEQCFTLHGLDQLKNADRLPLMISAGCSTARLATLPPYEPYLDVHGKEHAGTNAGEVFTAPPPPPATYQKGKFNPTGLGEQLLRRGPNGAVAYIGCNTGGQPCGLTLLEGFSVALAEHRDIRLGDAWVRAIAYYYEKQGLSKLVPNDDWYPPSIFFQGMKYMLYGDPTLKIEE